MSIMGHIDEHVAASALGALTFDEQRAIDEHCAGCPRCNDLLVETQESAHMLAFIAPARNPPRRCKMSIMRRIEDDQFLRRPTPSRTRIAAWSGWVAAGTILLLMMTWNVQLQRRLEHATMVGTMMVAEPLSRVLLPMDQEHKSVVAKMYMLPSSNYAVLVLENFEPAPAGKVYRVWVANDTIKSPINAFQAADKSEPMVLQPPEPLTSYKWIMVTMEDANETTSPDDNTTILRGDL